MSSSVLATGGMHPRVQWKTIYTWYRIGICLLCLRLADLSSTYLPFFGQAAVSRCWCETRKCWNSWLDRGNWSLKSVSNLRVLEADGNGWMCWSFENVELPAVQAAFVLIFIKFSSTKIMDILSDTQFSDLLQPINFNILTIFLFRGVFNMGTNRRPLANPSTRMWCDLLSQGWCCAGLETWRHLHLHVLNISIPIIVPLIID